MGRTTSRLPACHRAWDFISLHSWPWASAIFDNLDFERAVEEARRVNRYEFLFMAAPLRIEKGTGSPLNPLAIF